MLVISNQILVNIAPTEVGTQKNLSLFLHKTVIKDRNTKRRDKW